MNIIIYGAGTRGKGCYDFIKKFKKENMVVGFCDEKYDQIQKIEDKKVMSFDEACKYHVPFLVSVVDDKTVESIKHKISNAGLKWINLDDLATVLGEDRGAFNREFCAFFHQDGMNQYFDEAELDESINIFWGKNSPFFEQFKQLDLKNIIELACGRGRHVPHYLHETGEVTLVDILEENINLCKERFKDETNIRYYCNNGYNLSELESDEYTALFCYDAMVHFEMMDIYEYLKDIYRILVSGGKVLIHHSNNASDYKASFANAPHGRSFMSKDIFAYLAYRCGFKVLKQKEIDWGIEKLDCITLLQK